MGGLRHPFTDALYERDEDGNIVVTDGDRSGIFRPDGYWISGEVRSADPQLCGWVAGPIVAHHRVSEAHGAPGASVSGAGTS